MRRILPMVIIVVTALSLTTLPALAQIERQHYQCYDVLYHDSNDVQDVKLADQFGDSRGLVGHPVRLCNPVDKNGEGIVNDDGHLVCYAIRTTPAVRVQTVMAFR